MFLCFTIQAQEPDSVSVKSNITQLEKVNPELRIPSKDEIREYQKDRHLNYEESRPVEYPVWMLKIMDWFGRLFGKALSTFFQREVLITLFVILLLGLIVAIILRTQNVTFRNLFARKRLDVDESEFYTEDVNKLDFESLISESIKTKNYRLAIRFLYLKNLKILSDASLINWNPNKTNYSYQYEIDNLDIRNRFIELTRIFDFVWYGEFELDEAGFRDAYSYFDEFNNAVRV